MKKFIIIVAFITILLSSDILHAEMLEEEPMFHRTSMWFLSAVRQRKDIWEEGFHFGGFLGYQNRSVAQAAPGDDPAGDLIEGDHHIGVIRHPPHIVPGLIVPEFGIPGSEFGN